MPKKLTIAIAACVAELTTTVPTEIKLVPAGEFRARDGRPERITSWRCDAAAAARLIAQARNARGDFVIDYEHQTLNAEDNGQPAPAAGWFKSLEWREGDGLYATDVQWTTRARQLIEAGEYRYISPVFSYDQQTGVVTSIMMAALTNYPALDGHSDLAARAAAKYSPAENKENNIMELATLIALLGLDPTATVEQVTAGITALKTKADSAATKDTEIAALKATAGKPDPARFVPVETFEALKAEVTGLKAQQTTGEVESLIRQGLADGKLLPVQEAWAKELGSKDVAALKSYLEKTPAIAALKKTQTDGKTPEDDDKGATLSAEEMAVCKNLGISAEEYRKANPA